MSCANNDKNRILPIYLKKVIDLCQYCNCATLLHLTTSFKCSMVPKQCTSLYTKIMASRVMLKVNKQRRDLDLI